MRNVGEGWRRRVRSRSELFRAPEMWPLVGIAIVLLIVMMVGTAKPSHSDYGVIVDLAYSKHARKIPMAVREDAMRISVTRDGRVYFGVMQIQADDLPEKIRESLRGGAEKRVYMVVDSRARYVDVGALLDQVSLAGVEKVSFLTN